MSLPSQPPDRGCSVRRAWRRLAVMHGVLIVGLIAASLALFSSSMISAVLTAQLSMLGLWVAMGVGSALRRWFLACLIGIVLTTMSFVLPYGFSFVGSILGLIPFIMFGAVSQIGVVAVPLVILRRWGWPLVEASERIVVARGSPLQFRISHLFALTTFVVVILILRRYVLEAGTLDESGRLGMPSGTVGFILTSIAIFGVTFVLLSAAVVTGFWACLGPHPPGYRLTISAFLVGLLCAIPLHVSGGSAHVGWAGYIGVLWSIVVGSLLLLRHWGVRLVSSQTLRDVFPEEAELQA